MSHNENIGVKYIDKNLCQNKTFKYMYKTKKHLVFQEHTKFFEKDSLCNVICELCLSKTSGGRRILTLLRLF